MLDLLGSQPHQSQSVNVPDRGGPGHIERARDVAARIDQRGRRAGQNSVMLEEMLGTVDHDRLPLDQRRPDRIRPRGSLVPGHAGPQRHFGGAPSKGGVTDHVEQHAGRIGQNYYTTSQARIALQRIQLGTRQTTKPRVTFLQLTQLISSWRFKRGRAADVETLPGASLPRPQDRRGDNSRNRPSFVEEATTRDENGIMI